LDGDYYRRGSRRGTPKSYQRGSLSRLLVELAIATQIPMSQWQEAEQILTAIEILQERGKR
jgi:hypothetical protein